jgi:hypothetical protein
VRDILATDSNTLQALIGLLANATAAQKAALASGLAQAAKLYARTEATRQIATDIQTAVAATQDQEFILAYTAAAGDQPIEATGGAGGGGGGGGGQTGSVQNGGTNTGGQNNQGGGVSSASFSGFTGGNSQGQNSNSQGQNGSSNSVSP